MDQFTALHAQYTEMERQYKQALDEATSKSSNSRDLPQEVDRLKSQCHESEIQAAKLSDELDAMRSLRDQAVEGLKATQDQLSGTAEAYMKLQTDTESRDQVEKWKKRMTELEQSLQSSREDICEEQEAKNLALSQLQEMRERMNESRETADDLLRLNQENEVLRSALSKADKTAQQLPVYETITQEHSTPRLHTLPNAGVELYDGTQYSESELSKQVSDLREDLTKLRVSYDKDTSALHLELETERQNVNDLRQEMHESLNSSAHSVDAANIANLTDLVTSLQTKNEQLHVDKQELNKQLLEQEKLCEKLHERLGISESLSSGVQESYAKQLAAAQRQRDEILQQLEEATKVNEQVAVLVAERQSMQQAQSEVKVKLRERDDLEIELLKLKTQLESLTHSHNKMSENMVCKDQTGLEMSKRNAILESSVQQLEERLKDSEVALQSEKQLAQTRQVEVLAADKRRSQLQQRLGEEKTSYRNRLTAELEQTKAASEKSRLLQVRQERMEIERKYKEAIEKLRLELIEESKRKQETLKSQVKELEAQHDKQVQFTSSA